MWLGVMDIQLPGWVPGLTHWEIAWVHHGFLLPLRASSSKPTYERGVSSGHDNIDLHVCAVSLRDPLCVLLCSDDGLYRNVWQKLLLGVWLQMWVEGGLFQLLGWILCLSSPGIPGRGVNLDWLRRI